MSDRALATRAMTTTLTYARARPHAADHAPFTDHPSADRSGPTPPNRSRS